MDNNFFVEDNLLDKTTRESQTGRFILEIGTYKTKQNYWNYTSGKIIRKSDSKIIAVINRNYGHFNYLFFTKNNQDWLLGGSTYMSQTFVNCDTGEVYDNTEQLKMTIEYQKGNSFCWSRCEVSPNENMLMVIGCYWACPYEYKFFDIFDIAKGWSELKIETEYGCENFDSDDYAWIEDIFIIKRNISYFKYQDRWIELYSLEHDELFERDNDVVPDDIDNTDKWRDVLVEIVRIKKVNNMMILEQEKIDNKHF